MMWINDDGSPVLCGHPLFWLPGFVALFTFFFTSLVARGCFFSSFLTYLASNLFKSFNFCYSILLCLTTISYICVVLQHT